MLHNTNPPREGDLHSIVTVGPHSFELRYGYCDERDRTTEEPYILYPDLVSQPLYTEDGHRIVTALQSICCHYAPPRGGEWENCCYTCCYYPDHDAEIGICSCEHMRQPDKGGVR